MDLLISKLDPKYRILKLSKQGPQLCYKGKEEFILKYHLYWLKEHIRPISIRYHTYGLFLVLNFIYKCIISRYVEVFKKGDILMYETDTLLHPTVYITFHFPLSKYLSQKMRMGIVRMLFGSKKHCLIFYMDTDPKIAMERIRKRGGNIHAHENTKDLETLKNEFDKMVSVACELGLNIIKINTNNKSPDEITSEIQMIVERHLEGSAVAVR